MRPDPSNNPAVESVEERSDMGAFVILAPAPQKRIELRNQLLGLQRYLPFGTLPYPIHETADRLLLGVRVQRTLSGLTTNLALGQIELPLPALDLVAKELEAVLDMNNPRLLRMQLHAQLCQDSASSFHRGSCLRCRFTGDHPIIGVPRQLISSQSHLPIERRQKYVTERGRNHTPLRSATLTGKELPFTVAFRLEHRLDEAKHSAVRYPLGYQREKIFMIHAPENVSVRRIHDPLRPPLNLF